MSAFASFRAARWVRRTNILLQAILFLALFLQLNYFASIHGWPEGGGRIDLTRYGRFSLAPETVAYLKDLASPVQIYVTVGEDDAPADLKGLLREYVYATEGSADGRITVEYLDVDLRRRDAQQLNIDQAGEVVVLCNGNRHVLQISDLYPQTRDRVFVGEGVITAAILNVASATRKMIYFLVAHEELRPDDLDPVRGLSIARDRLRDRNFGVELLDLSMVRRVPADASLLVGVQPKSPYSPREEEMLREYLRTKDGRMILFLAPEYSHGLDRLLLDWGVTVDNDVLHDSGADNLTEDGDFIISWFAPSHPVTQALWHSDFKARLRVGSARSVRPAESRAAANGLAVTTLAATSPTAWGEVSYGRGGVPVFHPGVDIKPLPAMVPPDRLGIAVASERVAARDNLPFSVPTGRLVVFGTGDLIDNSRIANEGVQSILFGAVNWTVDSDRQLNIRPLPIDRFQISLTAREHDNLHYCLMFVLPGAAALLGLIVYWTRRN